MILTKRPLIGSWQNIAITLKIPGSEINLGLAGSGTSLPFITQKSKGPDKNVRATQSGLSAFKQRLLQF